MSGVMVTQADREAAASWLERCGLDKYALSSDIRSGNADDYPTVQAFARHAAQAREEGARMMREAASRYLSEGRTICRDGSAYHWDSEMRSYGEGFADDIRNLDPAEIVKGKA